MKSEGQERERELASKGEAEGSGSYGERPVGERDGRAAIMDWLDPTTVSLVLLVGALTLLWAYVMVLGRQRGPVSPPFVASSSSSSTTAAREREGQRGATAEKERGGRRKKTKQVCAFVCAWCLYVCVCVYVATLLASW